MGEVTIIGIDLAKRVFQAHGAQADGSVAFRKKLSRSRILAFLAEQPRCAALLRWRPARQLTIGAALSASLATRSASYRQLMSSHS